MKHLKNLVIKSLLFALPFLLAGSISASATDNLKIETDANEKSIYLSFSGEYASEVTILIKDDNEAVLHQEKVSTQKSFSKKFNLKNLPEGFYFLEISDEQKAVIQPMEVLVSTVEINPSNRFENYKPVYQFENNKLNINLLAINSNTVNIEVIDIQNQSIFNQEFKNAGKPFGQRLDLTKLEKGNYRIITKAGNFTYYKNVEVK